MDALGIIILCLTGLLARPTDAQSLQVAMNSTHASGHYGDVACPPGSSIEVLDAWAADTDGKVTCTLPLSEVDAPHLSEIQGCSGTRSCSHVDVVTGQYVYCPGNPSFGDTIDTIIVEFQCVPVAINSTHTSGHYGDVACPPRSVIEVLDAWAVDTYGQTTCTLPLSQVDALHLSEIQGCSGTRSCSHVRVVTGQYTSCPRSFLGDTIDTIIVEFLCVPDDPVMEVTTTGTSTEMTSPLTTRQGAPQTEPPGATSEGARHYTVAPDSQTPGIGLYIGVAVGAVAVVLLVVVTALVYRKIMRKRAKAKSEKPTDLLSVTPQGAPSNQRHRFSDYANHDHLFRDDPHGEVAHDSQPLSVVWGCPQRRVVTESESPEQVRSQNEDVAGVYMDMGAAGNVIPTYLELSP